MIANTGAGLLAFYVLQFHSIAENDARWSRGFNEWTNVVNAQPQLLGHDLPLLPADKQATPAREFGSETFWYCHYWFGGRRLRARPLNENLWGAGPDFPFHLAGSMRLGHAAGSAKKRISSRNKPTSRPTIARRVDR